MNEEYIEENIFLKNNKTSISYLKSVNLRILIMFDKNQCNLSTSTLNN